MTHKIKCTLCNDMYYVFESNKHSSICKIKLMKNITLHYKKIFSLKDIDENTEDQFVDYVNINIYDKNNDKCTNYAVFNNLFLKDDISLVINKLFWFIEYNYNKKMFYLKNTMDNIEYYYYRDKIIKKRSITIKDDRCKLDNMALLINIEKLIEDIFLIKYKFDNYKALSLYQKMKEKIYNTICK